MGINKHRRNKKIHPHNRDGQEVAKPRTRLEEAEIWSAGANRLQQDLMSQESEGGNFSEDMDMLALIVTDARNGIDVTVEYPDFYKKMLQNDELRQAFLDALDLLESENAGELDDIAIKPMTDFAFLRDSETAPLIERFAPARWRLTWELALAHLQTIFSSWQLGAAYRSEYRFLDENRFILLRDTAMVGDLSLDVFLEAAQPMEQPDKLQIEAVLNLQAAAVQVEKIRLQATLHWGDYRASALFDENGQTRFPLVALHDIWDEKQQMISHNLNFVLETLPT